MFDTQKMTKKSDSHETAAYPPSAFEGLNCIQCLRDLLIALYDGDLSVKCNDHASNVICLVVLHICRTSSLLLHRYFLEPFICVTRQIVVSIGTTHASIIGKSKDSLHPVNY